MFCKIRDFICTSLRSREIVLDERSSDSESNAISVERRRAQIKSIITCDVIILRYINRTFYTLMHVHARSRTNKNKNVKILYIRGKKRSKERKMGHTAVSAI